MTEAAAGPLLLGIPLVFVLFAATLLGVLVLHGRALEIALVGLGLVLAVRLVSTDFSLSHHLAREAVKLVDLLGLLVGFAQIARHFERSQLSSALLRVLPKGAIGSFTLLALVWLLSGVVDNIAAATIGATAAARIYRGKVHLGYLAAIVACANSGGAGSVVGDTTTTMMWLEGIRPLQVLPAYTGALVALLICGAVASFQQARYAPAVPEPEARVRIDVLRAAIVAGALAAMVLVNLASRKALGARAEGVPLLAITLWAALVVAAPVRGLDWRIIPASLKDAVFLLALVLAASLMPVQTLPRPSASTTFVLGVVSSVFDNIPLTKLALEQGGYDWGLLAYAVGMGGSMLWFGSSAGVAVSTTFPDARSTWRWLRGGWHVPVAFVAGYFVQRAVHGWHP
ncbi:MAG TPA: citrate transporter [Polyangia bacterium]|jgi:Na+/H+ antiporter NhaD/arsenite permease-like protein|nr:citrate transporter [Polyangia bacterium]